MNNNIVSKKIIRRKLQFAGNSSYVLTLPKVWIKSVGLDNKNSEVIIDEFPDGSLRIYPENKDENKAEINKELLIRIDKSRDHDEIIRLILAGYLASKGKITIVSKKDRIISPDLIIKIEELTGKLWGSEIILQSPEMIVLHDALDPTQMSLKDIISRAFTTAENMITWALEAIISHDINVIINVRRTENTLDKLYYFALRQLYQAASSIIFANAIGIYPSEVIDYHLLIKNIERAGDHANNIVNSIDRGISDEKILQTQGIKAKEAFSEAVKSFLKGDEDRAQLSIKKSVEVKNRMSDVKLKPDGFAISKSILRISDYASDIAELVINRTISEIDISE